MRYLFDTDHLSILQRKAGSEYGRLSAWMATLQPDDFACCVVSMHEQMLGAHNFISQAKDAAELVRGYELLERLPGDYLAFLFLPFERIDRPDSQFARFRQNTGPDN